MCTWLVYSGAQVTCIDNLITGQAQNVAHLMGDRKFRLIDYDVTDYLHVPGDVDYVLNFASPASPVDYLKWPIHTLKVGAFGTHKGLGLAYHKGRDSSYCLDVRGLRRSPRQPATRDLLGKRESNRAERCVRRGEALRRGHDPRLQPGARCRHQDRPDLQYLWPEDAR